MGIFHSDFSYDQSHSIVGFFDHFRGSIASDKKHPLLQRKPFRKKIKIIGELNASAPMTVLVLVIVKSGS